MEQSLNNPLTCAAVKHTPIYMNQKMILLVEPDDNNRLIIQLALEEEGYKVQSCASPIAAIGALQTAMIDLVVLDYSPFLDSPKPLIEYIHRDRPNVPVILMTTIKSYDHVAKALGAKLVVVKPFDLEYFLHGVQEITHLH